MNIDEARMTAHYMSGKVNAGTSKDMDDFTVTVGDVTYSSVDKLPERWVNIIKGATFVDNRNRMLRDAGLTEHQTNHEG